MTSPNVMQYREYKIPGRYYGFQVSGMIEWEQKSRAKQNPYGFQQNRQKNPWTKN